MKVSYYCIKKVLLNNLEEYNEYFIVGEIYDFTKDHVLEHEPYTHYSNWESYHLSQKELDNFFINKIQLDREKTLNKILEND